jgi:hypothetical protein
VARLQTGGNRAVATTPSESIDAALKLPESDRLIATRLLDTWPDNYPGLAEDDAGFHEELARRASDTVATISVGERWRPK